MKKKSKRGQLSLSIRPKSFDDFVGQEKAISEILEDIRDQETTRYLFYGPPGTGKTSIARIMALSFQCTHSRFGYPCLKCRKNKAQFNIHTIPCSKLTGTDSNKSAAQLLDEALAGINDYPSIGSRKRCYILDEPQGLSPRAQEYLLEILEEAPKSSIVFLCTTSRSKLIRAMRRRCVPYRMLPLDEKDTRKLISKVLDKLGLKEKFSVSKLAEALVESSVTSPGFIMVAIQKYISGASATDAAQVDQDSDFDHKSLTRCITSGDWSSARGQLALASLDNARGIRNGVASYLRSILLDAEDMDGNADVVAKAIDSLSKPVDDGTLLPLVTSTVYQLCKSFRRNPR